MSDDYTEPEHLILAANRATLELIAEVRKLRAENTTLKKSLHALKITTFTASDLAPHYIVEALE